MLCSTGDLSLYYEKVLNYVGFNFPMKCLETLPEFSNALSNALQNQLKPLNPLRISSESSWYAGKSLKPPETLPNTPENT